MRWLRHCPLLFASITLAAVAGCSGGDPPEKSKAAAEWVFKMGGTVRTSGRTSDIASLSELPESSYQISRINLNETKVTNADLEQLAGLNSLRSLSLYGTSISDEGLDHVVKLPGLEELEISYTLITDAGLKKLQVLPNLQKLYLHGMAGTVSVGGVKSLEVEKPDLQIIR